MNPENFTLLELCDVVEREPAASPAAIRLAGIVADCGLDDLDDVAVLDVKQATQLQELLEAEQRDRLLQMDGLLFSDLADLFMLDDEKLRRRLQLLTQMDAALSDMDAFDEERAKTRKLEIRIRSLEQAAASSQTKRRAPRKGAGVLPESPTC